MLASLCLCRTVICCLPLLSSTLLVYLSIEHHCSPVVLLFLQDKDNVSWQDLQLLSGLRNELVHDTVWLPAEGPRCGSSGPVRNIGNAAVLPCRENADLCLHVCTFPIPPELWVPAGCSAARMQDGAVPGSLGYPSFIQLT